MHNFNYINHPLLPLDFFFMGVGDDEEVVAVEFFGGLDKGIEFAFSGFLGRHIVANLYELLHLTSFSGYEINLLIVACAIVEQCFAGNISAT